ncbi:MAG: response regulator [Labilithrix sp.]|nr:response regulator [Labilithrix sp.]MCW5811410.1 response regulator [Labilithrix sp.]
MSFQPKRPSSPSNPAVRPPTSQSPGGAPSTRPHNVRDAAAEAHALGGGAVARPSAAVAKGPGKKTIFIVHPDADLRSRLRTVLEAWYDVMEAKDGMEAVEMSSSMAAPGMIVSDTAMPRVDGFTLAKILRNNPVMKKVPIMFVSAQHSPQHVTQALVIGVSQYLPKSTPVAQIAEKIRKIVV